jgi:hypothetical protein
MTFVEHVMAAPVIVRRYDDGRINPRSHVGGHAGEDPMIHRGGWRRAHVHYSRTEILGFVLWWVVIGALALGSVIFIIDQP